MQRHFPLFILTFRSSHHLWLPAALSELGHEPLRALIRELGGWPVANDGSFNEAAWVLEDAIAASRLRIDRNHIFMNRVTQNARNSDEHIATVRRDIHHFHYSFISSSFFLHLPTIIIFHFVSSLFLALSNSIFM